VKFHLLLTFLFFLLFLDTGSCNVAPDSFQLSIFLLHLPECWDYKAITITLSFDVFLKCTLPYIYSKALLTICFQVPLPILFIILIYFTSTSYDSKI
jgi:hypothetical protein